MRKYHYIRLGCSFVDFIVICGHENKCSVVSMSSTVWAYILDVIVSVIIGNLHHVQSEFQYFNARIAIFV